jgi:hypothetical protein
MTTYCVVQRSSWRPNKASRCADNGLVECATQASACEKSGLVTEIAQSGTLDPELHRAADERSGNVNA